MKLLELSKLTNGMTPEEQAKWEKDIKGCDALKEALIKVLQPKLNAIESNLRNVEELAKQNNSKEYIYSLLHARNIYQNLLDLLK